MIVYKIDNYVLVFEAGMIYLFYFCFKMQDLIQNGKFLSAKRTNVLGGHIEVIISC